MSDEQPSNGRVLASWLWALLPVLTFGVATAPAMVWAAIYRRNWIQGALSAVYLVLTVTVLMNGTPSNAAEYEWLTGTATFLTLGGLVHGLAARRWVFSLPPRMPLPYPAPQKPVSLLERQKLALEASREEAEAREVARKLVTEDPYKALELKVGRVDIPARAFPDGGLIDVNNLPPSVLAQATEITLAAAHRVAVVREKVSGFSSVSEMCALSELPPQTFDHVADRLVFPPKIAR